MRQIICTGHCGQGKFPGRCRDCRGDQGWRDLMRQDWEVPDNWDDVCPWGITLDYLNQLPPAPVVRHKPRLRGFGDTVAKFIHWISGGRIKPCCGCRKRQSFLNRLFPYKLKHSEAKERT